MSDHYSLGAGIYYRNRYRFETQYPNRMVVEYINTSVELRYKFSSFSENGFFAGFGAVGSGVRGSIQRQTFTNYNQRTEKAAAPLRWETILVPKIGYLETPNANGIYSDFTISYEPIDEIEYIYEPNSNFFEINKRLIGVNFTFMLGFVF